MSHSASKGAGAGFAQCGVVRCGLYRYFALCTLPAEESNPVANKSAFEHLTSIARSVKIRFGATRLVH